MSGRLQPLCVGLALAVLAGCGELRKEETDPPPTTPASVERAPEPPARYPIGLWILAEGSRRVLEDATRIDPMLDVAERLEATDLFVQVYRGGRSWYPSQLADPSPFESAGHPDGVDPLALLLERAHARNMRVHAWVNVLSLSTRRDAKLIEELGPEIVLVDNRGRSLLSYPNLEVPEPDRGWYRMGTRGVYLDAAAPGVAKRLVASFTELVSLYPELDGIHLDYIRQPGALPFIPGSRFGVGLDFGYGEASIRRFQQETGLAGPYRDSDNPDPANLVNQNAWDDWRRQKVTDLVEQIARATRAVRPDLVISAAVNSYLDRAYLSLSQDWMHWLKEGYIDLAIPMVYTLDDRLLGYQLEHFIRSAYSDRIWPGLGVWLFARRPEGALNQIRDAHRIGASGLVLFSYDSIADAPDLLSALESNLTVAAPVGESSTAHDP